MERLTLLNAGEGREQQAEIGLSTGAQDDVILIEKNLFATLGTEIGLTAAGWYSTGEL